MQKLTLSDYQTRFKELNLDKNLGYPKNEIGFARLFYDLHHDIIAFIHEPWTYYSYDSRQWQLDGKGIINEVCKNFVQALVIAQNSSLASDDGYSEFAKYVADNSFHGYSRRKSLIADARSIAPKSIAEFDKNPLLFNCSNGVYDLGANDFRGHDPSDYITKVAQVKCDKDARCDRWEQFIDEITVGDTELARFLQKALGYSLSGETFLECLFILYGRTTRNGKSTLTETIAYLLGEYAMTMQPQTLARRSGNGASASPDIARLKGARFVNTPEPEKNLKLDAALVKQVTGGDSISGRLLFQNPIEFRPDFKIFINTNHLPKISDPTVFSSGRIKVIPFNRHFKPNEQDKGLKKELCRPENLSGILNWLIEGYKMLQEDMIQHKDIIVPDAVRIATEEYQDDASVYTNHIDDFFSRHTEKANGDWVKTVDVYQQYKLWAGENFIKPMRIQDFNYELRRCFGYKRDGTKGNMVEINLKY